MRILVTGANGFSGRHLVKYLSERHGDEIFITDMTPAPRVVAQGEPPAADPGATFIQCNLTDEQQVARLIDRAQPDRIFHLAGTFTNIYDTDYCANVSSSRYLLESIHESRPACRILLIGSSAEYGIVTACDNPVREDHVLSPVSIYGLTKVYQTYLGRFHHLVNKTDVVIARPFNLLGAGISRQLFVGHVYQQIEEFRHGRIDKISVGNLESRRDYVAVEEAVRGYVTIMDHGIAGEVYNVGSGQSIRIRDLLARLLTDNGLDMTVVEERQRVKGSQFDVNDIYADLTKLKSLM